MKGLRIVISGGGTGGHIFPAISIADAVKRRFPNAEILFVGAENRMEMTRVPDAGYKIIGLPVSGFNRKALLKNIQVLWRLYRSMQKSRKIIKDFKPHIAVGVGGYASGPLLKVANSKGIPTLLQEQNSYPGVTNKILASGASAICVAYEGMDKFFPKEKIILTGNPCRENLKTDISKEEARKYFNLTPDKKTILVVGGSLGSRTLNRSVKKHLDKFGESNIQVIWQAGDYFFHDLYVELQFQAKSLDYHLCNFIDRMDLAYKAADLVVSRAGAGAISELCLLEKPVILVPSPNVAEDHQTKNAMALVAKDAAVMLKDEDAEENLVPTALEIIKDDHKLNILSENIAKLAQPDSANRIVDEIVKIVQNRMRSKQE